MSDKRESLKVDVDTRLLDIWEVLWEPGHLADTLREDEGLATVIGSGLRAAYVRGYLDALQEESQGRRGELAREHGYREPYAGQRSADRKTSRKEP